MVLLRFRAWDKETKTMNGMAEIYRNRNQEIELRPRDENIILMQSTGLKDKNGKEIFEGDIITNGQNVMCMKKRNTLGFYIEEKEKVEFIADCADLEEFEADAKEVADNIEIIGNIYKNPELLEVTE